MAKRKLRLANSILALAVSIFPLTETDKQTANRYSALLSATHLHTLCAFAPHKATAQETQRESKPSTGSLFIGQGL
jgi:hypothetical protein